MAETTNIEWCDATLNLWWGCTKVSAGCKHCYAEAFADGWLRKGNWGPNGVREEKKGWRKTLAEISARTKAEGRRLRVFCQSMSDTFEGAETMGGEGSENWATCSRLRAELFEAIDAHDELDFLLLTKRPENVVSMVPDSWMDFETGDPSVGMQDGGPLWPENVWIGISAEDQKTLDERAPYALDIPAPVVFLSLEPLIGAMDARQALRPVCRTCSGNGTILRPDVWADPTSGMISEEVEETCESCGGKGHSRVFWSARETAINWVIVGGESGRDARPMLPAWSRTIRDQCAAAGVPFFFKQIGEYLALGEWATFDQWCDCASRDIGKRSGVPSPYCMDAKGRKCSVGRDFMRARDEEAFPVTFFGLVGKRRSGRELDNQTHDDLPVVKA